MKKHSMTAILARFDRETARLQKVQWAKDDVRYHEIQAARDKRGTDAAPDQPKEDTR